MSGRNLEEYQGGGIICEELSRISGRNLKELISGRNLEELMSGRILGEYQGETREKIWEEPRLILRRNLGEYQVGT